MLVRILISGLLLSLSGCVLTDWMVDPKGACEWKLTTAGRPGYSCVKNYRTESQCSEYTRSDDVRRFNEGESCTSLGYTYPNPFNSDLVAYTEDRDAPSPHGEMAAYEASISGGGGGGGDGGGGSCGPYQGPEFDIQIDSQCKAAHIYSCSGSQQAVDATCAIYNSYSSVPNCPYCN